MANRNILMKKRNGNTWDTLYPITLDINVIDTSGVPLPQKLENTVDSLNDKIDEKHQEVTTQLTQVKQRLDREHIETSKVAQTLTEIKKNYTERKAIFAIVDDDCRPEAYTILKPMLEQRNIRGTFSCITGQIGQSSRLSEAQIREMVNAGHEFISHSHTHRDLTTLTESELHEEFKNSKAVLQSFGQAGNHLAYPNGTFNKRVVNVAQKYFDSALVTDTWLNRSPLSTYAIGRIGVGAWGNRTWDIIKSRIDRTIEVGGLGVIMTHVGENTTEDNQLVEQTIDYILSQGHEIKTYGEAFKVFQNKLEYGEFNEQTRQVDFVVGFDGTIGGNYGAVYRQTINAYTNANPLSDFKRNTLTINAVQTSQAQGLPLNTGGTLMTFNFGSTDEFAFQLYEVVNSDQLFFRRHGSSGWGEWQSINPNYIVVNPVNAVTASTPATGFPNGKITYTKITNTGASGFPDNKGGLLTTNRISNDQQFVWQTYEIYESTATYKRYWLLNGQRWSDWRKIVTEAI